MIGTTSSPLLPSFFRPNAVKVARALLGAVLVRRLDDGTRLSGRIVETEAYTGHDDLASHGRVRKTPRNLPMWGAPGHAYVYLCHGIYWLLNVVAEPQESPAAVLIRALEPLEGLDRMIAHRGKKSSLSDLTRGPGRLSMALAVTGAHNTLSLTDPACGLWIEKGIHYPDDQVITAPRVGMGKNVSEPWYSIPWRFCVRDHPFVSDPRPKLTAQE